MLTSLRIIPGMTAAVLILFFSVHALPGGQIEEKQDELKKIEKKLEQERKNLGKYQSQERFILKEMDEIEKKFQAAEKEIIRLNELAQGLKDQIDGLTAEVTRIEEEISRRQDSLRGILISAYKIGPLGGAKFIWAADSLREFDRGMYLIRRMSGEAGRIINQCVDLRQESRRKKQQLEEQLGQVNLTESKVQEEKNKSEQARGAKARLIEEVRSRKEIRQQLVSEMEAAAQSLENMISYLSFQRGINLGGNGRDFAREKGKLHFPTPGVIVSGYGMIEDPEFHTILFRKGIEIETGPGEAVRALEVGEVLYSGWLEGYGNVIIIDHGNGYFTLSARLKELGKGVGDQVQRGEIIGRVSGSGPWGESGLYFEIRHKGQALDPEDWLAPDE